MNLFIQQTFVIKCHLIPGPGLDAGDTETDSLSEEIDRRRKKSRALSYASQL